MNKLNYILFSILILILSFSVVNAKSYTLDKANVDVFIYSDSSISVYEDITFDFSGNFTFAYRDIPNGNWNISDIEVLDNNLPLDYDLTNDNGSQRITWYFNAANEKKTFTIYYVLTNAINSYDDISEFNWKLWGQGWDHSLNEFYATIYLPKPVNDSKEVYTYGHPELNGKIGMLDNNKIILQVFDIPANQFVELRLLFPNYVLDSKDYANVKQGNGLQKIINEEANYGKINWLLIILSFIALFIAIFFIWYYLCRSEKVDFQDIYLRDIPYDYSPSVAGYVYNYGLSGNYISADILNICLKKKMQIEKIPKSNIFSKDDYKFIIKDKSNSGLSNCEIIIFEKLKDAAKYGYDNYIIFQKEKKDSTPNEVLLSEFKTYMKKRKFENMNLAKELKESIEKDADKEKINMSYIGVSIIIILLVAFGLFGAFLDMPWMLFSLFGLSFLAIFRSKFIKMDKETKLQYLKWKALRKYLKDFSDFNNKEVMDIKLWERYLVYAIPLGVAKKVEKNMKIVFENYNGKVNSTIFVGSSFASINDFSSISNSFDSALSSAMSTSGSSGFSGGSSGGGGGGGGGAG